MKTYDSIHLPSSVDVSGTGPSQSAADAARCGVTASTPPSDVTDYVVPPTLGGAEPMMISDTFQITVSRGEETIETMLIRSNESESFGFSLSNGINESGVFIGAVKEAGPAAEKLKPYDRLLQVRDAERVSSSVAELLMQIECSRISPMTTP